MKSLAIQPSNAGYLLQVAMAGRYFDIIPDVVPYAPQPLPKTRRSLAAKPCGAVCDCGRYLAIGHRFNIVPDVVPYNIQPSPSPIFNKIYIGHSFSGLHNLQRTKMLLHWSASEQQIVEEISFRNIGYIKYMYIGNNR